MNSRSNALVIFTKNPVLGKVKTRLAKSIGENMALRVYMQLLKHTREITQELDICEKKLFYDEFIPAKDNWKDDEYDKFLQGPGDLDAKISRALKIMFDEGYEKVIIMSPDCPELTSLRLKQAFTLLDAKDFVIGPLKDGGYYLLGMKRYEPQVVEGIEYGNGTAYMETIRRIESLGMSHKALPETYDVDHERDIPAKLRKQVGLEEITSIVVEEEIEETVVEEVKSEFPTDDPDIDMFKDEPLEDDEVDDDGEIKKSKPKDGTED
ncbi:MAG: TIGR04282 family arsenosugar biosynthesis glycosyltransferase [Bacteroidetes bacterium]|nr:TIGR04282 family arsenosugar biosynthesis glycosyltransferase [Bacteroidota bacterium]